MSWGLGTAILGEPVAGLLRRGVRGRHVSMRAFDGASLVVDRFAMFRRYDSWGKTIKGRHSSPGSIGNWIRKGFFRANDWSSFEEFGRFKKTHQESFPVREDEQAYAGPQVIP